MPAAYQRSRPAAMAASDRIRHSGPRSAHSGDCGTAPIHEHLASARHMHRTPSVRDDASRRPARFSHRAASPPVRDNIVRSPARFSYKAASPPVREDVLRRQAYESGRSHRGFSAADAPDQSTLLQVHRQSSSSQLQAQASMLQQGAAESTGGSVHTVSPALYGHDLQGDPSQHRAYAQAFVPNQSPAHGGSQHDRRSSVHAHTPSSLPWPHKQQQQAQPQTQHQAETQHLAELPDPYQALQPPQQQVQKAAAAPLNCAAVHEMNQYPAAGEIGQPPNCSVAAQQHHHQHHLLRHSSRLAVPPTSEWRGESNSSDSSGSSSSQVHPQQQSCIGAANHSQDHVDKKHGDDGPAQHVVCQANDARHVPLKQPAEPPQRTLSKQEAFDAVRTLLKPLYTDKLVSKEQFKAVAQSATHDLVKSQTSVEREIKQVVIGYLASAGLHQAVLQLS